MFTHLDDRDPPSPGPALADRVRAEGRRRRLRRVRLMGGALAVLAVVATAAVARPWSGDEQGVVSNEPSATDSTGTTAEPSEPPSSTTTSSTAVQPPPEASTTSSSDPPPAAGSLASATVVVRAACRELYDYDFRDPERRLTPDELAARCDVPAIEWRSDCYAERPPAFVPGDGGCAYLGGYLAVWHGEQSFPDGRVFRAGDDVWTVIPESD